MVYLETKTERVGLCDHNAYSNTSIEMMYFVRWFSLNMLWSKLTASRLWWKKTLHCR